MKKASFIDTDGRIYRADSCIPLEKAWEKGDVELNTFARGTYPGNRLKKEDIPGIKSIGYWNARKAQDWGLEWHKNEGIEICFLESGSLEFLIGDACYELEPHDMTITRPWLSHKLGNPTVGPSRLHWIILDVSVRNPHQEWLWPHWIILNEPDLDDLTRFLRQNEQPVWKTNQEIFECFSQIGKTVDNSNGGHYDSRFRIYVNTLLMLLLDLFRKGNIELNEGLTETKRSVELFLSELPNHLNEEWTLKSMADQSNLGVTQFTKYCKQVTNCTPLTYLNNLRLKYATELLRNHPTLTVTDIGYQSGYSSPQYFTTSFKRYYKLTPQAYREKYLKPVRHFST